jgi:twitching motility protein PilT
MAGMYRMNDLLDLMLEQQADELRIRTGRAPAMRVRGKQVPVDVGELTADNVAELFESVATEDQVQELDACGDIRFQYAFRNTIRLSVSATVRGDDFDLRIRNPDK